MSGQQSLGSYLRDSRKEKKISMRALARNAGISVAYLSKIEQNDANPTIDVLERIADALSVSVADLALFIPSKKSRSSVIDDMPESLKRFIEEYSSKFPSELSDPEFHRALSGIRFRGRYPSDSNEWLQIFMSIRNVLKE